MRIPVLIELPAQEPLTESAMAARERRAPRFPITLASVPAGFALHTDSFAVPLGGPEADVATASLSPEKSEMFAVHGFLDAKDLASVPAKLKGCRIFSDPTIAAFQTCVSSVALGDVAAVRQQLGVAGLGAKGLDGSNVAVAIMDAGINLPWLAQQLGAAPRFDSVNSWTPPGSNVAPGQYAIGLGTMCAFDALIAAPNATLLDVPILAHQSRAGAIVGSTLGVALQGYTYLLSTWAITFGPGAAASYAALVVSNSWGMYHPSWDFPPGHPGRYVDNPQHPFNLVVGVLAGTGADIVFAAGNCGSHCPYQDCQGRTSGSIMGANAHADVMTVAGCDVKDQWVGYSSQGPSIANMPPRKPDITAYTHFLGSEALGAAPPDLGTSAACPVAAGCVAALRTKLAPATTPPATLIAQLRHTARTAGGRSGWNPDFGHGILDPLSAAKGLGL